MVAALALMDVSENCLALIWLNAALVDTNDAAPDQLSVDYGVGCRSALHLPSQDFSTREKRAARLSVAKVALKNRA